MKRNSIYKGLYFVVCAICMYICARAQMMHLFSPFAEGFAWALLFVRTSPLFIIPVYIVSKILVFPTWSMLICSVLTSIVLLFAWVLHAVIKKRMPIWVLMLYACVGYAGQLYFYTQTFTQLALKIVELSLSIMFFYACATVFSALKTRGASTPLTLDEKVCGAVFVMALTLGLCNVYIVDTPLVAVLSLLALMVAYVLQGNAFTLALSVVMGIGVAFFAGGISYIALFGLQAIALIVGGKKRLASALYVVSEDICLGIFFNGYASYSYIHIALVALPCFVYAVLPEKWLAKFQQQMGRSQPVMQSALFQAERLLLKNKLQLLADTYQKMQKTYTQFVTNKLTATEAQDVLVKDTLQKYCKQCPMYSSCFENAEAQMYAEICAMAKQGLTQGSLSVQDVSPVMQEHCVMLANMVAHIASGAVRFSSFQMLVENENTQKQALSEHLQGMQQTLVKLIEMMPKQSKIDTSVARAITEELRYHNITVSEAFAQRVGNQLQSIFVQIPTADVQNPRLVESLSRLFHVRLFVSDVISAPMVGWKIVQCKIAPKIDVVFGTASIGKHKAVVSGDTYTMKALPEGKYLLVLSDGKGHGKVAHAYSSQTIELVEQMYAIGFDTATIVANINGLLAGNTSENFSAMDICLVDTIAQTVHFLKFGSSVSVYESNQTAELIQGENLPLGIVQSASCKSIDRYAKAGDVIVLASDGVTDTFENPRAFLEFVAGERLRNMQMLAESVLEESLARAKQAPEDDMTVIAFRVIPNS